MTINWQAINRKEGLVEPVDELDDYKWKKKTMQLSEWHCGGWRRKEKNKHRDNEGINTPRCSRTKGNQEKKSKLFSTDLLIQRA